MRTRTIDVAFEALAYRHILDASGCRAITTVLARLTKKNFANADWSASEIQQYEFFLASYLVKAKQFISTISQTEHCSTSHINALLKAIIPAITNMSTACKKHLQAPILDFLSALKSLATKKHRLDYRLRRDSWLDTHGLASLVLTTTPANSYIGRSLHDGVALITSIATLAKRDIIPLSQPTLALDVWLRRLSKKVTTDEWRRLPIVDKHQLYEALGILSIGKVVNASSQEVLKLLANQLLKDFKRHLRPLAYKAIPASSSQTKFLMSVHGIKAVSHTPSDTLIRGMMYHGHYNEQNALLIAAYQSDRHTTKQDKVQAILTAATRQQTGSPNGFSPFHSEHRIGAFEVDGFIYVKQVFDDGSSRQVPVMIEIDGYQYHHKTPDGCLAAKNTLADRAIMHLTGALETQDRQDTVFWHRYERAPLIGRFTWLPASTAKKDSIQEQTQYCARRIAYFLAECRDGHYRRASPPKKRPAAERPPLSDQIKRKKTGEPPPPLVLPLPGLSAQALTRPTAFYVKRAPGSMTPQGQVVAHRPASLSFWRQALTPGQTTGMAGTGKTKRPSSCHPG